MVDSIRDDDAASIRDGLEASHDAREVTIPMQTVCEHCRRVTKVMLPFEWLTGRLHLARLEEKIDAVALRLGLLRPQASAISVEQSVVVSPKAPYDHLFLGKPKHMGVGRPKVTRLVCFTCSENEEKYVDHKISPVPDSVYACVDCLKRVYGAVVEAEVKQ